MWCVCVCVCVSIEIVVAVYGVELTTLVKMEGHKVPAVIRDCIEEVESRGEGGKEGG